MRTRLSCALARARLQPPYPKKKKKRKKNPKNKQGGDIGTKQGEKPFGFFFFFFSFFYPVGEYPRPGWGVLRGFLMGSGGAN